MEKPEIRFKGYTDEWEQRKLPEFVSFFNGLTYTPDDVEETGTLVLRSSNVKNGEIIDADNVYVNDKVATSENVQEGDIIVVVRNGSRALIGKHAQIKVSMPNTVIGAFMSGMRSEHSSFVNALLDTSAFENEIAKNMGATINQITGYMFSKMEFMIPSGEEQQQIGEYFQSLDNLITLHQRKCDEVKTLNKYMLQKMFPQNEQKVPEIRFEGFTEAWEQRKLGDVTESIKNGYTYKADGSREHLYKITRIESISSGAINIEKLGSSDNVNENYKLEDGDILFSHINSLPYIANTAIYTSNLGEIYHGMNLLNIRAKHEIIDSHFLLHLLKKESSRNWFRIIAKPAVNQASISTTEVSSFVFMMPNMEEQKRISSVLDNIDNLLTLHQQKCEELKKIKKFMLQKMFV